MEILGALSGLILVWLILLGVLLPFSAYSAQKYAYRCHQDLSETNRLLRELVELTRNQDMPTDTFREAVRAIENSE